jgi:hypothetical protein
MLAPIWVMKIISHSDADLSFEAFSKRSFSFIFCVFTPNPASASSAQRLKGTHRKKKILNYTVEIQRVPLKETWGKTRLNSIHLNVRTKNCRHKFILIQPRDGM